MDVATAVAARAGLVHKDVPGGPFTLATWSRLTDPKAPLTVYIAGDGLAWLTVRQVSLDPTPTDPLALRLAALDPAPNVVYVARPCQYQPPPGTIACASTYWTHRIFSPEVIRSTADVIRHFADETSGGVRLVGYSGGGALAVLVAPLIPHLIDLRTVAGNIDTVAFVQHHDVTPYGESANPADIAPQLKDLPQIHFIGARDVIVPSLISRSYARHMGASRCLAIVPVLETGHEHGWVRAWPALLGRRPACTP
ncbi:MAG TPA: alpha/beta hydrolase [Stellaceae bacterium]|nr:alpha/beta hydrolase [Stellaceae bacterium]